MFTRHPSEQSYLSVDWTNPINWNHPLNDGLAGWWLNVPHWQGGTVFRDLLNLNHGTLTGMDPATDWVGPGNREGGLGALDFDGSNDFVDLGSKQFITSGVPFTSMFWATVDAIAGIFPGPISFVTDQTSGFVALFTDVVPYIPFTFGGRSGQGWGQFGPAEDFSASLIDQWNHFAIVYNGGSGASVGSFAFYLNGVSKSLESKANLAAHGNVNRIGQMGTSSNFFDGSLDDIRVYSSRDLNASEVRDYYGLSRKFYPGLLRRLQRRAVRAAVAPSTTIPIMDHHYRMMRAG